MYCTITPNKSGGCSGLIEYLDKEDSLTKDFANYLDKESELTDNPDMFFNEKNAHIDKFEVIDKIDNNCKGLSKDESRFFSLTLNPSAKEIDHIKFLAYNEALKLEASGIPGDFDKIKEEIRRNLFKQYTVECMNNYAKNFDRPGINDNKDLVWFGKVEQDRYWKYNSAEVKSNKKILTQISRLEKKSPVPTQKTVDKILELKSQLIRECDVRKDGSDKVITEMMPKSGDNYHIHVVVSRRDKEQMYKLSPLAKCKSDVKHKVAIREKGADGKMITVGTRECRVGFDRNQFVNNNELSFDKSFNYERAWAESYEARKLHKENPEKYKEVAKEKYLEENRGSRNMGLNTEKSSEIKKAERISEMTVNKFTQEAGLKYVQEAKPYFTVAKTAIKGISVLRYNQEANKQMRNQVTQNYNFLNKQGYSFSKSTLMKGTGLAKGLSTINPYVAVFNAAKSFTQFAQGNQQGIDR